MAREAMRCTPRGRRLLRRECEAREDLVERVDVARFRRITKRAAVHRELHEIERLGIERAKLQVPLVIRLAEDVADRELASLALDVAPHAAHPARRCVDEE